MLGIKKTEYTVLNDENGQKFKEQILKKYDTIDVKEIADLIVITIGETFETNDFMWV